MQFSIILKKFPECLIILLPIFLLTGSFLSDLAVVLIVLFFLVEICSKKKFFIFKNKIFIFLAVFCIYISILSFFALDQSSSMLASIFYIRFPLFALSISYFLGRKEKLINNFFYTLLFSTIFLCIDIYIQKIFGYDIFGVQLETSGEGRVSALFGKEYIAGSYLARLFPILVLLLFFINQKKKMINENIYLFILVVIFGTSIFITLERTSFLMFLISLLSLIFITRNYKLYLKYIFFFFIILILFLLNDLKIKNRYNDLVKSFFSKEQKQIKFSSGHFAHMQTAYIMFSENPFFGVGIKNYRVHCQKPQFFRFYIENNLCKVENNTCTTHPHNIPFQFLSETGIFGFFFYFFSMLYLMKNFFFLIKIHIQLLII